VSHSAPVTDQTLSNRLKERAKLMVRGTLHRLDLELSRGPYPKRLALTLEARGIDAIIDVGGNVGQFASMTRRAGFPGRIVSCEPLSGAYGELRKRSGSDPDWTAIHTAVGAERGSIEIHVSANSVSSSILDMTDAHLTGAPGSGYIATESVGLTTVRALVAEHGLVPSCTLLKIDTQGYEDEVLAGAGELIGEFAAIQLELSFVELYAGQRLFDDFYELMRSRGYRLHIIEPGFSDPSGRMMQCDGLFVRADGDRPKRVEGT
jgi:FkbM family methyltransferase